MSDTPETDAIEKYSGVAISGTECTCGDEKSSMFIPVIHARVLERDRDKWRECADRLYNASGWHDQWPMAVAHYKKLKKKYE